MTDVAEQIPAPVARAPLYRRASDGLVDTADLPRILWHRRAWIGALAALFVLAAVAYSLLTPWLYVATAQILIDPRDKVVVSNDVNPSVMAPDGGVAQVESQVRVIESTNVLLRAIKAADLLDDPEFGGRPTGVLSRIGALFHKPSSGYSDAEDSTQRAVLALSKRIAVKRADKVFVIDIAVTARSPDKAARIANALAQAYLDDQAAARTDTAVGASDALAARLEEQKKRVNEAETAVERYKAEHALLSTANGALLSDQQLTDVSTQLEAARTKAAEAAARLDQIAAARRSGDRGDATAEALGSAVMTQLRAREATLADQRAQAAMQLGPRHPSVVTLAGQYADVERLIDKELGRILRAARADDERARANVAALQARLAALTTESMGVKQASVRLHELERDLEASRTVYAAFLLRTQETREQASIDSSNARIITQAMPPRDRSWPLIGVLVLGGLCGGLGIGAAGAFAVAYVAPVILSQAQLRRTLNLPVTVVTMPRGRRRILPKLRRPTGPEPVAIPKGLDDVALDFVLRRVVEATPKRRGLHQAFGVVLTGGRRDAARSAELAQALAAATQSIGDRVLLVDATAGDGGTTLGLLDVLRGDAALDRVVRRTPPSRVATLGPGTQLPGSADLRAARSADQFVAQAARRFDIMVVDGGVAAENVRLAPLLPGADEIILVAERGRTSQREAVEAAEALMALGCRPSQALLVEARAGV